AYGVTEADLPTFCRVMPSIPRGCPSTGWMLALGVAPGLQGASYWPADAQDELFTGPDFVASASFGYENAVAVPVDGGYRVTGTWHFCSGVPYAAFHMGLTPVQDSDTKIVAALPRGSFRMLDNWGDLIGLNGSGAHSAALPDA